ncbi:MAG: peptide deformylase [Gammaproteobacteria bacterium]
MPVKKLLRMGDEKLLEKSTTIKDLKEPELQLIINDLIDSMHHYGGAGIAAPQIGYFIRVFVFLIPEFEQTPNIPSDPLRILINPEVEILTEKQENTWEGCLSVPGYCGLVPRYTHLKYRGYDRNGCLIEQEATGIHAYAIQHEHDHLEGILYPMRIKNMRDFGCDDMIWKSRTQKPYPEERRQKINEQWNLMG